jgi:TrmH family RNA methyltransferase
MRDVKSRTNPLIKHLTRLGRDAGYRREHGLMLCEGEKMLAEALSAGVVPRHAVFSHEPDIRLSSETEKIRTTDDIIKTISSLKNPSNMLFTVQMPELVPIGADIPGGPRSLTPGTKIILDRLQDPGNVGSIIRTACAFGISCVILTPGSADISNPKTLRAAMGAVFSQRFMYGEPHEIICALGDAKCYTTGVDPKALPLGTVDLKNCAVVIGNEGSGVSDIWKNFDMITIPIEFESLGAANAAAIIMWEAVKC